MNIKYIALFSLTSLIQSKIIFVSTKGEACGLNSYVQDIMDHLEDRRIHYFHFKERDALQCAASSGNFKYMIFQFHGGLPYFTDEYLSYIASLKSKWNIKAIFVMHEISGLYKLKRLADYFITHTISDPFRKIIKLAMPYPKFQSDYSKEQLRQKYGFGPDDKIISTFGFMFKFKGHSEILGRMIPYLKSNKNLKLQLVTALHEYNSESKEVDEKIKHIISQNRLESQVAHIANFAPKQEVCERLFISDVGFLWANKGGSGEVSFSEKYFYAVGLPLVVANCGHFLNVGAGAIKLDPNLNTFVPKLVKMALDDTEEKYLLEIKNTKESYRDTFLSFYRELLSE